MSRRPVLPVHDVPVNSEITVGVGTSLHAMNNHMQAFLHAPLFLLTAVSYISCHLIRICWPASSQEKPTAKNNRKAFR